MNMGLVSLFVFTPKATSPPYPVVETEEKGSWRITERWATCLNRDKALPLKQAKAGGKAFERVQRVSDLTQTRYKCKL